MSLKRGSVLGVLVLYLVLVGIVDVQAQGSSGNRGMRLVTTTLESDTSSLRAQVDAMQAQLDQALATIAQLQTALNSEVSARQAADAVLQNNIDTAGGVTQAVLDAAIAAEANTRSTADAALEGQIANEAAAREASDATLTEFDATLAPLIPLAPLAPYVAVATGEINGLAGPHVIFSGANVHVQSGSGDSFVKNGRGNFVIGYNEPSGYVPAERGGSHNLVVGANHRYDFAVGLITGYASRLGHMGASVSGGFGNTASGMFSSVSGGRSNEASGQFAHVSGGDSNVADGNTAAVSAGQSNHATGALSSVSGGSTNTASAVLSTVGGGANQINATGFSFVP